MSSSNAAGFSVFPLRFGGATHEETATAQTSAHATRGDDDLLLLVQSGDREALGVLFDRYARLVLSVGLRIIKDSAEAEDLVHDVFLFLLGKSNVFDPTKGSARAWLAKVTYHRALDRRKYLVRRCFYDRSNAGPAMETRTSNGADCPEFWYWHSHLRHALRNLSEEQRTTLTLHFFEGFTINEISEKLGQSRVNVRNYYYRGLERLRSVMEPKESTRPQ